MNASSSTTYETWVRGLRAWRDDPTTDLSHLPPLDETSFPPVTYNRLIDHLNQAINHYMTAWNDSLLTQVKAAKGQHELARALVDARRGLAYRLVLARHPSLPETIRSQLLAQAESDIRSLQQQLEDSAQHAARSASTVGRTEREAMLRMYRDNALTAVLDPGFILEPGDAASAPPQPPVPPTDGTVAPTPFTVARPTRRVVVTTPEE